MQQITVGTTVVMLAPAGNRDFVAIYNNGSATIYIQYDGQDNPVMAGGANVPGTLVTSGSTLTTGNGWPVPAGTWYTLSNDGMRNVYNKAVFAVAGTNQDVRLQGV